MSRILHRSLHEAPHMAARGQGMWVETADGHRVLDGSGGAAVACLGHGDSRVAQAIADQLAEIAYVHTGLYSNKAAEELADILLEHEPGGLTHAFFVSSGSEAMEAALKLARQYFLEIGQPQRTRFIARRGSYHGTTLGALSAGGNAMRRAPYLPLLSPSFSHVSPCFAYRFQTEGETDDAYVARLADELEAEFQRLGPDNVIAFCAEPMVGATTGCVGALPGYFPAMRAVCDRHGALLILDEVMCGMGRLGTTHAWEQEGVTPDIQVVAKGLAGGYQPIGGILVARRVIQALASGSGAFMHGQTYQAHPVACAAAVAVQKIIRDDHLLDNVNSMGSVLTEALHERFGNHAHIGDIRGRGLFQAIELVTDRSTKATFDPSLHLHEKIKQAAYRHGVAVYPMGGTIDGRHGDHVIVAPPYIATRDDIVLIVDRLSKAIEEVLS